MNESAAFERMVPRKTDLESIRLSEVDGPSANHWTEDVD